MTRARPKPKPKKPLSEVTVPEGEAWLTVDEAAVILRIGRNVAYAAARAGELPGVMRIGRQFRVRRSALLGSP